MKKTIRSKQNLRNGNLPPFIMLSISRCFRTMNAVLKNEIIFPKGSLNSPNFEKMSLAIKCLNFVFSADKTEKLRIN